MKSSLIVLILMSTLIVGAQPTGSVASSKSKAKVDKPEEKPWSISLVYRVGTDMQKSGDQRTYTHMFATDFSYDFNKNFGVSTGTSLNWLAEGQNIRKEQDNPNWDDLNVSGNFQTELNSTFSLLASIGNDFPTGNESRNEGIKDTINFNVGTTASMLEKTLLMSAKGTGIKYFHSYDLSIVSNDSNVDSIYIVEAMVGYKFFGSTTLSLSHKAFTTRQINGELWGKNATSIAASYKYKQARVRFEHVLGNYEKSDGYQLLFVDETKQVFRLGVSFEI